MCNTHATSQVQEVCLADHNLQSKQATCMPAASAEETYLAIYYTCDRLYIVFSLCLKQRSATDSDLHSNNSVQLVEPSWKASEQQRHSALICVCSQIRTVRVACETPFSLRAICSDKSKAPLGVTESCPDCGSSSPMSQLSSPRENSRRLMFELSEHYVLRIRARSFLPSSSNNVGSQPSLVRNTDGR